MMELMKPKVHHNKHQSHHKALPVHKKPVAPKSDPLFEMMKMMQPQASHQVPMTHWGHQFQIPTFEQQKFDFKNFNLF